MSSKRSVVPQKKLKVEKKQKVNPQKKIVSTEESELYVRSNFLKESSYTFLRGEVSLKPWKLLEVFGYPNIADFYKTTGQYMFVNREKNHLFTLYDWKATKLYDEEVYVAPEAIWFNEDDEMTFHVGGNDEAEEFIAWLKKKLE